MAEVVYQDEVAVVVLPTFGSRFLMMHMQLFVIEEGVLADRAYSLLSPGDFLSTGWEVSGFRHISLLPVVLERGVIW